VLQQLVAGIRDRLVLAVTFLAMLELVKRREIVVDQDRPWGPIVIRASTPAERAAAGITDAALEGPLDESLESFA
jgi:chromatin segregation and condensation protein Rec8/ScpA/Scc1 (kleisin family)